MYIHICIFFLDVYIINFIISMFEHLEHAAQAPEICSYAREIKTAPPRLQQPFDTCGQPNIFRVALRRHATKTAIPGLRHPY